MKVPKSSIWIRFSNDLYAIFEGLLHVVIIQQVLSIDFLLHQPMRHVRSRPIAPVHMNKYPRWAQYHACAHPPYACMANAHKHALPRDPTIMPSWSALRKEKSFLFSWIILLCPFVQAMPPLSSMPATSPYHAHRLHFSTPPLSSYLFPLPFVTSLFWARIFGMWLFFLGKLVGYVSVFYRLLPPPPRALLYID